MEKGKKKLLITAVVFVLILAAAAVAYQTLSQNNDPGMQLAAQTGEASEEAVEAGEEADLEDTKTEEDQEGTQTEDGGEAELMTAPDFTMQDSEGMSVNLSDLFGKPIVMNFWSSGCNPCKMEMPDFQAASEELGDEVLFVMVDSIGVFGETVESGSAYVEEQGYTFPVFYDVDQEGIAAYGITSFPTTFFLNEEGQIVAYGQGMMSADTLDEGISMILP